MGKKADAWKEYKEAALVDMMMKVLPKVTHIHSDSCANIENNLMENFLKKMACWHQCGLVVTSIKPLSLQMSL